MNARLVAAVSVAVAFALLSAGSVARAASPDRRELEARADYAAGRYQKAVDGFASLFADTADPVYLRNIGRCYQKMKRPQEAVDSFQEYLQKAKSLSKTERHEIEGFIKDMEALKAEQSTHPVVTSPVIMPPPVSSGGVPPTSPQAPPAPAAPTSPSPSSSFPSAPAGTTPGVVVIPSETAPPPGGDGRDGRSWRIAGLATAAGGAAFIAVGIAYGLAARSAADSVSQQYSATTESDGKRDATLQWIGYGVGGAALVTGALLYWHGLPSGAPASSERTASLHGGATFDRNGGALVLGGVF